VITAAGLAIYQKGAVTSDPRTGTKATAKVVTTVKRAICLPDTIDRSEVRSLPFVSANKSTVVGGQYDTALRDFIIDRRDVPSLELTEDDWIVFDRRKYAIRTFDDYFGAAWLIQAKAIVGEVPEQVHLLSADHLLNLTQSN
jgi:hypothetical protein